MRANSSNQHSSANGDTQIENALISAGIRWNATDCDILSGGKNFNSVFTLMPTGIQSLEIGARNGGISPINGYVASIEIGTRDITLKQLGQKLQQPDDDYIVGAGQSLIRGYFYSKADSSEGGKQKFREVIGGADIENAFVILDGTTGSSAACKTTDATNYWWDNATSTSGPALDNFFTAINAVGGKPNAILWGQGEEDCHVMGVDTTPADYKQAVLAIFAKIRQGLGDIPIYIQSIGQRTDFSNTGGIQAVRDIQKEIIAENSWCYLSAEIYDLALFDAVHLTNASFVTAAERNALALMKADGATGSVINNATRIGTTITVTLTHDNGDNFTSTSGIEGFKFFDNLSEITINSAVKTNATTITLTLASTPISGSETLYYGYDAMIGLNINNVVRDNADVPMPMRTGKITLI